MASKDGHDPGWNDPPIVTYIRITPSQAAAASKKGTSLNKRVAFPISSNVGNQQNVKTESPIDSSRPPLMLSSPPSSTPANAKLEITPEQEVEIGSKERLERVLQNLQVQKCSDEEVVKRIKIMEKMWLDGKLLDHIQIRVLELSEALASGDTNMADCIQQELMVRFVCECSPWMSGIRHLINQKRKWPTM